MLFYVYVTLIRRPSIVDRLNVSFGLYVHQFITSFDTFYFKHNKHTHKYYYTPITYFNCISYTRKILNACKFLSLFHCNWNCFFFILLRITDISRTNSLAYASWFSFGLLPTNQRCYSFQYFCVAVDRSEWASCGVQRKRFLCLMKCRFVVLGSLFLLPFVFILMLLHCKNGWDGLFVYIFWTVAALCLPFRLFPYQRALLNNKISAPFVNLFCIANEMSALENYV